MASIHQIRGLLLEEALLYLLRHSGYKTITEPGEDPTLHRGNAGLEVKGRGSVHQIDAIADYTVAHPFSHPQRLLVEAKFQRGKIGVDVLRNAVGVLTDVNEYWVTSRWNAGRNIRIDLADAITKNRYHYQYAIFSATKYAPQAETYAFAHDIYLIPLARSRFMEPVLEAIGQLEVQSFGNAARGNNVRINMTELRRAVRAALQGDTRGMLNELDIAEDARIRFIEFLNRTRQINNAIIGMLANQLPVFLVQNPDINLQAIGNQVPVRIFWDQEGWYLRDRVTNEQLFSFDLPEGLFNLYANEGILTRSRALDLKQEYLANIQAIVGSPEETRVITLRLDQNWLRDVRRRQNN